MSGPIRFAVCAAFMACELNGISDPYRVRRQVLDYAREALEGGELPTTTATFNDREETRITAAGCIRITFLKLGVDRHDLGAQGVLFARIDDAITVGLARDWPPRLG
jgi:hypothetical protein